MSKQDNPKTRRRRDGRSQSHCFNRTATKNQEEPQEGKTEGQGNKMQMLLVKAF